MARYRCLFVLALTVSGCAPPVTRVDTVDNRPHLQFAHASPTAIVSLDGAVVGPAAVYDGRGKTLVVEAGTHHLDVRDGARLLYSADVFFGDGATKTIELQE